MTMTLAEYERGLAGLDADIAAFPSERYSTHSDELANLVTHGAPLPFKPNGVVLTCGSELTPVAVDWLWRNWLALGKFHLLAGAPGQGKTTIASQLRHSQSTATGVNSLPHVSTTPFGLKGTGAP